MSTNSLVLWIVEYLRSEQSDLARFTTLTLKTQRCHSHLATTGILPQSLTDQLQFPSFQ